MAPQCRHPCNTRLTRTEKAMQDVEAVFYRFTFELPVNVTCFKLHGCQKVARQLMRRIYEGAEYHIMFLDCKRRKLVTFTFGQIHSVIKTTDTMEEALKVVGRVLNQAIFEMMLYGEAMYRLPDKRLLFYPMEGLEDEDASSFTASVPVKMDTPARLQQSDLRPCTLDEASALMAEHQCFY